MPRSTDFALKTERLGPLPLINHFIERIGLEALLEQHVPTTDRRCTVAHARALGVLLRSIVVEREPIYRQLASTPNRPSVMDGSTARSPTPNWMISLPTSSDVFCPSISRH